MERLSALVLDDNSTSLCSISMMLEESNFRVFPFQTVEAALDFIKSGTAKEAELDLVLVEVRLNDMASQTLVNPELLHHMNELQVPLITMFSYDDAEALSKCVTLGARFLVLKPLDTGSFNMVRYNALEHKSKKATPQGTILNRTRSRMASNPKSNGYEYEETEKPGRIEWTVELHEKFLEAIKVLGGEEFSTPHGILSLMNVKGLTSKHISSHLQKHRLKQRKAKQGGQCQGNASTKPVSELIIAAHNEAISESITPGGAANSELHPLRLQTQAKKRLIEAVVLKTYSYTCSSGIYRNDTKSVWDEYEKNLQKEFSGSNKRWLSSSLYQCPPKNKVVITDEGVPNEPNKTAGDIGYGASTSSGLSSLLTINQVGENNRIGANRENNHVGSINFLQGEIGYGACIENFGSGSLPTSDKEGEINPTEVARDTVNLGNINLLEGYGAYIQSPGSNILLKSDQVGQINCTEAARDNDEAGNINLLEGIMGMEYTSPTMDPSNVSLPLEKDDLDLTGPSDALEAVDPFFISQREGSQEQRSLGQDDLQQISGGDAWTNALYREVALINTGEPMAQGPQEQQSLALDDHLQVGDNARNDLHRSVGLINIDEPMAQGPMNMDEPMAQGADDAPVDGPMVDGTAVSVAQDYELWG